MVLFLWILIIFLAVLGLAFAVSPLSPEAQRGLPRSKSRRNDD